MIDYHIHTDTSPDAQQTLGDVVKRAREMGMTHIAITDHYDFPDNERYTGWIIKDLAKYSSEIKKYNEKFDDLHIAIGIEIGHVNSNISEIKKVLDAVDFDFIIASTHYIEGYDPYHPEFFNGRSKEDTYYSYLKEIRDSIDVMDERVSVLGHIGYAARYSPYEDNKLRYEDFSEIVDEILHKVINRGFGIELNTSNYGNKLNEIMPPVPIINRYRQLGGEIITIGADSHNLKDIGKEYNIARQIALDAGFKYLSVFRNLTKEFILL